MKSEIKGDRESEGAGKKLTDKADHPGDMHTHTWSRQYTKNKTKQILLYLLFFVVTFLANTSQPAPILVS